MGRSVKLRRAPKIRVKTQARVNWPVPVMSAHAKMGTMERHVKIPRALANHVNIAVSAVYLERPLSVSVQLDTMVMIVGLHPVQRKNVKMELIALYRTQRQHVTVSPNILAISAS